MTTSTSSPAAEFAAALAELRHSAEVLASLTATGVWSQLPVAAAPGVVAELFGARDLVGAVASAGVGAVHTGGALPGGHVSTKRWLEVATGMSASSAGAQLARSRALGAGFTRTRLAWLAGEINDDMVRVITTGIPAALRRLDVAEQAHTVDALEAQLVPYAITASITEVRRKLTRLRIVLDPDGADERTLAAYDDQQLTLTPVGDGYEVRGYLSKESAAAVLTCLDQTVDGWFRDGSLTPEQAALAGDDPLSTGRRRMRRSHLNALALADLCERLLGAGELGSRHQVRPHVTLTVHAEDYRAGIGGDLHIPGMEPEPISAATVDRILCDADVTAVLTRPVARDTATRDESRDPSADESGELVAGWLTDAAREVLYVGRAARTAPPRLRKALEIRDRHCQFPHCRVQADRCHAHHVRHWEHGGGTDLDQMVLLCHGHHHLVHEAGWQLTRTPGTRAGQPGYWQTAPPERRP
jgi:hypothetical protein